MSRSVKSSQPVISSRCDPLCGFVSIRITSPERSIVSVRAPLANDVICVAEPPAYTSLSGSSSFSHVRSFDDAAFLSQHSIQRYSPPIFVQKNFAARALSTPRNEGGIVKGPRCCVSQTCQSCLFEI